MKPFTVVVGYANPDDFRDSNTHHCHVMAMDADGAGVVAIDGIILDAGMCEEDNTEDLDYLRADYKCLAIYAGHLENLVKP